MSLSKSTLAYEDCYAAFEQAMEWPNGARVDMQTTNAANVFRMRLHQARVLNRDENTEIYPEDHPLYGRSKYDTLSVSIVGTWIYIRKRPSVTGLEPIPDAEADPRNGYPTLASRDAGGSRGEVRGSPEEDRPNQDPDVRGPEIVRRRI